MFSLAVALRHSLIELASARQALDGQQTKTEMVYQYLTGPRFRHRVEAIVEAFSSMQEDLDREKKAITKQWAKREEQIERVMQATVGMYGDLQAIAGKPFQEIEGLELTALESKTQSNNCCLSKNQRRCVGRTAANCNSPYCLVDFYTQ